MYGIISFTIEPNPEAVPRHGNLWLSTSGGVLVNVPLTVNSSACTFSVNPASAHFGASGGAGTLAVTPSPSDCVPIASGTLATFFDSGTWFYGIFPNTGSAVVQTAQFGSASGLASGPNSTFTVNEDAGDSALKVNCVQWAVAHAGYNSAGFNLPVDCGAVGGTPPYTWSTSSGGPTTASSGFFYNTSIHTAFTGFYYTSGSNAGPYNFLVQATDSSSSPQTAAQTLAGTILPPLPYIICPNFEANIGPGPGQVDLPYTLTCMVGAGTPPYQWSISAGAMPSGLSMAPASSGNGITISGSALSPGSYSYTLQAIDGSNTISTHVFAGTIVPAAASPSLTVTCNPLPIEFFEVGIAMPTTSCTASGGQLPYHFGISGEPLPPGIQMNQTNGTTAVLSGAPTDKSLLPFVLVANDSSMPSGQTATVSFGGFFASQLVLTCGPDTGPVVVGQSYTNTCLFSGGSGPDGVTLTGSLPDGLDYSAGVNVINSAAVTGTPTTPGPYSYTISVTDSLPPESSGPARVARTFSGTILPCSYTLSPGGLGFLAQGGNGAVNIAAAPGCAWTVTNVPAGITLTSPSSGAGNGTVTFTVLANNGNNLSESFAIGGQAFTIYQQGAAIQGLNFAGSMAHLAAEENWTSTFTLVNKGMMSAQTRLSFFGDAGVDPTGGGPLSLLLTFPPQSPTSGPLLTASLDQMIAANASSITTTAGPQTSPVLVGSAQLAATGAVDGFAIFHHNVTTQEAVVPLETRNASSYLLAFDNTAGMTLGVAVDNVSQQSAIIPVIVRDDTGAQIATDTISLAANGHYAFTLAVDRYPDAANKRGTIEFDTPAGGRISVLGLRFTPPNNALTTIPALANVGIGGGSIAHLASGGDGWQTTFVLVNAGTSEASATLRFFADQTGLPLSLPLSFPQGNATATTASSVIRTLAAGATLVIESGGGPGASHWLGATQHVRKCERIRNLPPQ